MSDNTGSENILYDLKKNFVLERQDILLAIQSIETKIAYNKEQIESLSRKEDSDFELFSPRSSAKLYESQIMEKETEIEALEEELRATYKRLSNVTKQLDSLKSVKVQDVMPQVPQEEKPSKDEEYTLSSVSVSELKTSLKSLLTDFDAVANGESLALKFIKADPVRAGQSLEMGSKKLEVMRKELSELIGQL